MNYTREHHRRISNVLHKFNSELFHNSGLLFGGGTRIALELGEFRVSTDIDIVCPTAESYRVVREQVTQSSLGSLVTSKLDLAREIRSDRDAVRTAVLEDGEPIKLEFIRFNDPFLSTDIDRDLFPIPALGRATCFYTKLLANADRYSRTSRKDIIDILAMCEHWGTLSKLAMAAASETYGPDVITRALRVALEDVREDPNSFNEIARGLGINSAYQTRLIATANMLTDNFQSIASNSRVSENGIQPPSPM